jgi:hypothetical protein
MTGKAETLYAFAPTALLTNSASGSNDCESDDQARSLFRIRSGVGEPTNTGALTWSCPLTERLGGLLLMAFLVRDLSPGYI